MLGYDQLYEECAQLEQHYALADFYQHLAGFLDRLGFYQHVYTVLPVFSTGEPRRPEPIFHTNYDPSWMERYRERRYDLTDCALAHCLTGSDQPFVWHRDFKLTRLRPQQRRVVNEAAEVGIKYGFTIPLKNCTGAFGAMSATFAGKEREFDSFYASRKYAVEAFAMAFNEAIVGRFASHFGNPFASGLTPKEREALNWLAWGHTYDEIAAKMTVGVSTVRKHISRVISKLHARNSTHACILALRWGIIK